MVVNQVQDITLRPDSIITPLKHIAALIHEKTGYNLWQEENISSMIGMIPKLGQWVVSSIFDFGVNIVVLLFVLYFMLIGGRPHRAVRLCPSRIFLRGTCIFCQMSLFNEMNVKIL